MADEKTRYCPRCGHETDDPYCPNDGTATVSHEIAGPAALASFSAGSIIDGRYRVLHELGRGGFGAVYAAEHTGTGQEIALKVMLVGGADADRAAVRRFYKEAQVTARLRHPNTVRVFDVAQTDEGALYIAMELLNGPTLEDVLRDLGAQGTAMTERQALDIAIPALRSLGEAHAMDLVHRDLKPANIMLSEVIDDDPIVKVLDFGIARTRDSSLTGQGTALGTPAYMSPEQCLGRTVDGRSDIYALGVIIYRCLAGRTPFDDRNPLTIMYKHAHEPPKELITQAKSAVTPGLNACVMRALSKKVEDRFASAKDMRAALTAVREGTWRADMDGQDAASTATLARAVAQSERPLPPGDTVPYGEDALSDTEALSILDGDTADALEQRGRTVAYVDDAGNESQSAATMAQPALSEALAASAPAPSHPETAEVALPAGGLGSSESEASKSNGMKIAMLVVGGLAAFAGVALVLSSGGTTDDDAAASGVVKESKAAAGQAQAPTNKPENAPGGKGKAAKESAAEPAAVEPKVQPDAGGNTVVTKAEADAGTTGADAESTVAAKPKQPAAKPAKNARKERRKARRGRRARTKRAAAPPPPPVRVAAPPPPPPRPKPQPKPKPKPKPTRPIALD